MTANADPTAANAHQLEVAKEALTLRVRVLRRCPDLAGWFHVIDQRGERLVTRGSHVRRCFDAGWGGWFLVTRGSHLRANVAEGA